MCQVTAPQMLRISESCPAILGVETSKFQVKWHTMSKITIFPEKMLVIVYEYLLARHSAWRSLIVIWHWYCETMVSVTSSLIRLIEINRILALHIVKNMRRPFASSCQKQRYVWPFQCTDLVGSCGLVYLSPSCVAYAVVIEMVLMCIWGADSSAAAVPGCVVVIGSNLHVIPSAGSWRAHLQLLSASLTSSGFRLTPRRFGVWIWINIVPAGLFFLVRSGVGEPGSCLYQTFSQIINF